LTKCYSLFYINGVQRQENVMKAAPLEEPHSARSANFIAARDSRNRKVRGVWTRGNRYYLQYRVPGEWSARRVPLVKDGRPAANLTEALEAREEILYSRRHGVSMPARGRKPLLSAAIAEYISHHRLLAEQDEARRRADGETAAHAPLLDAPKKLSTVRKEELILARWLAHIGDLPLDRIERPHVTAYLQTILEDGRTRRTRNVHLSIFRNLLRFFSDKGLLVERSLPTAGVKLLRHRTPHRDFLTTEQVQRLILQAEHAGSNGAMLADLLKLLAYCGAREMEALRLRWRDVDFETQRLHIGRDGQTKNREPRTVDFSPDLAAHLRDMHTRKAPDSPWLFPSPKRADRDVHDHWQNPHKVWYQCRRLAGLPHVQLHDLRHHFASRCVMLGIDYMTTARWLGHLDGGILVGKTYGHLADEHKREMAARLFFSPRVIPLEASVT
jgi:integrase